jgi:hypothetical protein
MRAGIRRRVGLTESDGAASDGAFTKGDLRAIADALGAEIER